MGSHKKSTILPKIARCTSSTVMTSGCSGCWSWRAYVVHKFFLFFSSSFFKPNESGRREGQTGQMTESTSSFLGATSAFLGRVSMAWGGGAKQSQPLVQGRATQSGLEVAFIWFPRGRGGLCRNTPSTRCKAHACRRSSTSRASAFPCLLVAGTVARPLMRMRDAATARVARG